MLGKTAAANKLGRYPPQGFPLFRFYTFPNFPRHPLPPRNLRLLERFPVLQSSDCPAPGP